MKDKFVGGWDNTYNISEENIHPSANGELGYKSNSSASSESDDALNNLHYLLHEVSVRKCGRVTQSPR